jgi:hypothetical protein
MKNTNLCLDDEAIFRSDLCLKSSVMTMMNEMGSGLFWVEREVQSKSGGEVEK